MMAMSTATLTTEPTELSPLAERLNRALAAQDETSPLNRLDRCDRCPAAAQSQFFYQAGDIMLCGHHARAHLSALIDQNPTSFWIEPSQLRSVRGVNVPAQDQTKAGDGLTDG